MKTKKSITFIAGAALMILMGSVIAQPTDESASKPSNDRRKAIKVGIITNELELTSAEAEKFWPVYNEFEKSKADLMKGHLEKMKKMKKEDKELTDAEYESIIETEMGFRQKMLELEKNYYGRFKSVVPPKKVAKLYEAEQKFMRNKKSYQKRNRKNKGQPEPPPPPPPQNPDPEHKK